MGTLWHRSGTIERFGASDLKAAAAKAYVYQANTTVVITTYSDFDESSAHPHPVVADAYGRWPDIFVPYAAGPFDVKVTTAGGVQLTYTREIPNAV